MSFTLKSPESAFEWETYYQLRWKLLRAPWHQALGSERDEFEDQAFHVMALNLNQDVVGVGRLHRLTDRTAQIRYMAVPDELHGKGIGTLLLTKLEDQARAWGCQEISLNARETAIGFYLKHGYEIVADAPLLFGSIVHKQMCKSLS